MNAYAVKPVAPFVTRTELRKTPATSENKEIVEFMDSHDFSFSVDDKTKVLKSTFTLKEL